MNTPHFCSDIAPMAGPSRPVSSDVQRRSPRRGKGKARTLARAAALAILFASTAVAAADDLDTEPGVLPAGGVKSASTQASSAAGASLEDAPELMAFKDIPVVVAAGKREQTELAAPASVSVIDANTIELFNYDSLAQALRNQRSFFLHTDGLNWMLGERGFLRPGEYNARILVTVDGRPTNDMIYGQSHLDEDFVVPMEAVKQVEVIRGPGSALYGTNAVFGVINVVTKDGADINGTQVRLEGGTKDSGRASVLFGQALPNGWDVVASVTGYTTQGDGDVIFDGIHDAAHDYGHVRDSDNGTAESLFIKARKGDFTIQFDTEARIQGNRSATYLASFYDPGEEHEQRTNFTVKFDHEIETGKSIHGMFYYGSYGYQQDWEYAAAPPVPEYRYHTMGDDGWLGQEVHYDWQATKEFHLLVGADGRQSLFANQHDYDSLHGDVLNIQSSLSYWGIFAEGEEKLTDWLSLTVGGRVDNTQRIGVSFSPRFAAIFTPTKVDTIKVLYGRAFRTPNLYELMYASPGANVPNPNLKSEVVDTYELVYERQFKEGWRTSLDGFVWKMSDAMEDYQFPDGALQTRNGSNIWAQGVEAEIDRKWSNGANLRAYASFTHAARAGNRLLDSPEWIMGTALVIPIYKDRTFLSIEPQLVGQMKDDLGNYTAPTYLTNIVLTSKDILPGWDVQAGVYNLFANSARLPSDGSFNHYQSTLDYPTAFYEVGLTYRF
ncbi:MAG TPA: TonB-dependent receptor [Tepidisphaeraceae bacterium]|jgi:iron complex outermembrane receptor protein|nr:TonB-dependent receptor [Tepidisphaeraceae bacterium]